MTGPRPIEYCEEIMIEIKGKYNEAKIFTDVVDLSLIHISEPTRPY